MPDIKNNSLGDCENNHYNRPAGLTMDAACIKSTQTALGCNKTHKGTLSDDEASNVFSSDNKCMFPFALDIGAQCVSPGDSTYCSSKSSGRAETQINCDPNGTFEAWDCMGIKITTPSPPASCPNDIPINTYF